MKITLVLFMIFFAVPLFSSGKMDKMYVQALKTEIKSAARAESKSIATLKRGDEVAVFEKSGLWFRVKNANHEGWVSRLFLSAHPPVGKADLDKDVPTSLEKANRRRAPSYAVSASARGLMIGERARHGREMYQMDPEALGRMENFEIPTSVVDEFSNAGGLNR